MKSLKNLKEIGIDSSIQNLNDIKGGKRAYGLVKWGSAEVMQFFTAGSAIVSAALVNARTIQYKNAQGDDICVEW
jgi:hypothetical protein